MSSDAAIFAGAFAAAPGHGPLWQRLALAIDALIGAGSLAPGAVLPPERDLAQITGVSRVTVRAALRQLVAQGKLARRQGSGTFVAHTGNRPESPRPQFAGAAPQTRPSGQTVDQTVGQTLGQSLGQSLISLSEDMRRRGLSPSSQWLTRGIHMPVADEIMALALGVSERVARLERLRLADGRPLAVERTTLPAVLLPDPEAVGQSLFDFLAARGVRAERAVQRLSAANATPRDAEALGILPGAAVLKVERITYLPGGRAAEFSRAFYRGDAYDIVTELR